MSGKALIRRRDGERGTAILEMAVAIIPFFLLIFGVVEFSYIFYQWNSATKATQWGARLAAVSSPVASNLATLTGLEPGNNMAGDTMPAYDCLCSVTGTVGSCTGTVPSGATACTYDGAAMKTILLGRGNDGTNCVAGSNGGMCRFYPALKLQNIVIRYQNTGMGYAGRPGGPIPTVTVSLQNVNYQFVFLRGIARLSGLTFPARATSTVTGEDLKGGS